MTIRQFPLSILLAVALVAPLAAADVTFARTKLTAASDLKESRVTLALSDSAVLIQGKNAGSAATQIPYSTITKVGYAFTDRRRVTEGIIIAPVLALTKSQSHWMVIESASGDAPLVTILRLDKSEYRSVIAAMNARSGKRVEVLDSTSTYVVPTVGSSNVDETVPFAFDRVMEALKPSMEAMQCKPFKVRKDGMECRRRVRMSGRTGWGGERVNAILEASGEKTRVRITTVKGMGRNWSPRSSAR